MGALAAAHACHKMVTATKPFPQPNEAVLKQSGAYPPIVHRVEDRIMQFILELIWDHSCSRYLTVLPQE
jgi:hypothetical protein